MSNPNQPLDREAKRRMAVIRHVEEVSGNVALKFRYYGISRQAYYIWYRRYQAEGIEGLRTIAFGRTLPELSRPSSSLPKEPKVPGRAPQAVRTTPNMFTDRSESPTSPAHERL